MRETLVLLPGWGIDAQVMAPLAQRLSSHFHVLILALPGLAQAAPDQWLDALEHQTPRDAWLVGWSLGGMLAGALAARRAAGCPGLITLASNACFTQRPGWPQAMPVQTFEAFYRQVEHEPELALVRFARLCAQGAKRSRELTRALPQGGVEHAQALGGLRVLETLDNRAALTGFAGPQLHLLAEHDALVPVSVEAQLRALNPSLQVQVLTAMCHAALVQQPDAVASAVASFVEAAHEHRA